VQWNLWIHSLDVSTCLTKWQHWLTSIGIFCRIWLPCPCFTFAQNIIIWYVRASDYLWRVLSKSIQNSCKVKEIAMARDRSCDRQGTNIMPSLQQMLWRRNNSNINNKDGSSNNNNTANDCDETYLASSVMSNMNCGKWHCIQILYVAFSWHTVQLAGHVW